jgi:hypothetical protein
VFDWYSRRARLAPIALAAGPAVLLGGGSLTALDEQGSLVAFILSSVGLVACGVVRNLGLRHQPELWRQWDGPPTTKLLRWRSGGSEVAQRHERLTRLTGRTLPTREEEKADPGAADDRYDAAIADLRDLTRDRGRFPLVAEENADYGFRRNCLGLRPIALAVAAIVCLTAVLLLLLTDAPLGRYLPAALGGGASVVIWSFLVRPPWVREAADHYATRLLETLASLTREQA